VIILNLMLQDLQLPNGTELSRCAAGTQRRRRSWLKERVREGYPTNLTTLKAKISLAF